MEGKTCYRQVFIILLILSSFSNFSCSTLLVRELSSPSHLKYADRNSKNIKLHMKDGCLFVLDSLITDERSDFVKGYGLYYNQYRDLVRFNVNGRGALTDSAFNIAISDVSLIETNTIEGLKGRSVAMALVAVPTVLMTGYCLLNPKACFGSCPTFYSWDGRDTSLMAEGFSSSILRTFEKDDIDMLYWAKSSGNIFHLRLKNEALETHIIRYANLMVIPRSGSDRVFATEEGGFFRTSELMSPAVCNAAEGDCRDAVKLMDHRERFSASDSDNLASREVIEMSFENVTAGDHGLIIGCRQTLLTTYLFYQSLAYLGKSAGYFAAKIENGDRTLQNKVNKVWEVLGGIEVFMRQSDGEWEKVDQIGEMGPLATDVHLVRLPFTGMNKIDLKLRLTKGLWRIDYLALGKIEEKIEPKIIEPSLVVAENCANSNVNMKTLLKNPDDPLVTLPGDTYDLVYSLPDIASDYEIYLHSKGYYLEWMRETWLAEENHKRAALLFGFPKLFMKIAANDFKIVEPSMEESFWNSKYVKKN